MKLNELIKNNNVTVYGFPAFKQLEELSNKEGDAVVLATTPAPVMLHEFGISEYYAPVMPRNSKFTRAQEIIDADLDLQKVQVFYAPEVSKFNPDSLLIVTRHEATVKALLAEYPGTDVFTDNATPEIIAGRVVIGVLPPALIAECKAYVAATVKDYDAAVEGDLSAEELRDRLSIMPAVTVTIC